MSSVVLQIAIIVLLILLNGFFAMSETALVSSRKAHLRQRAEEGARGARTALALAALVDRGILGDTLPARYKVPKGLKRARSALKNSSPIHRPLLYWRCAASVM